MMYIVGLGNPGDEYVATRHNVGFMMLDALVKSIGMSEPVASAKYAGQFTNGQMRGEDVTLLYPETFMNNSGSAVAKLVPKDEVGRLVVIYDDVDVPTGQVKVSTGRGSGGHNGVESIINSLGTKDFIRIRVGIAPVSFWSGEARRPQAAALSRHVLGRFTRREERQLEAVKTRVIDIIGTIITDGVERAMNQYN